jgi:hypothetical protein
MAECLARLPATQVARVQFPVPDRPTFSVEKWLFSVTLRQEARSQALQLRFYNGLKNLQLPRSVETSRLECLCRPGFVAAVPGLTLKSKHSIAKVSHILRAWEYRIQRTA